MSSLAKLASFFDRRDRFRAGGLLLLMLLGAAFEALGIAAILPFIALIDNAEAADDYRPLRWLSRLSGLGPGREFLIWCGTLLILLYLIKGCYLGLLYALQHRFLIGRQVALSRRLLAAYVTSPYTFHLQRNSAELQTHLNSDVVLVFTEVLVPLCRLVIEALVALAIVLVLIIVRPALALQVIGILGGLSAAFYLAMHRRAAAYGELQHQRFVAMTQWVNQALGGVKEARLLGREMYFVESYARASAEYARATRFFRTASELPRLGIESITVVGMLALVVLLLARGRDVASLIPMLGVFALAAVRLMPSLNRMVGGVAALRFFGASIDAVYRDLRALREQAGEGPAPPGTQGGAGRPAGDALPFTSAIELQGVCYRYPGAHGPALREVSLTIPRGRAVAFVGSSGAGKSTLVDVILGLLTPVAGRVLVDGVDIQPHLPAWQRQIGYIPQAVYLLDDTLRRNVAFGLPDELIDDARVWDSLAAAQLADLARGLPAGLDTRLGERGVRLSGGQRQRIGIARALYHDPAVLVLDEATSAVDYETERDILRAIAGLSGDKTIITVAHRLSAVRHCDTIFLLRAGRVTAAAPYDELLATSPEFRCQVRVGGADARAATDEATR